MGQISQVLGWITQAEAALRRGLNRAGLPAERVEGALKALLSSARGQEVLEGVAENFGRSLFYSVEETLARLEVTKECLNGLVAQGEISVFCWGGASWFSREEIEARMLRSK